MGLPVWTPPISVIYEPIYFQDIRKNKILKIFKKSDN